MTTQDKIVVVTPVYNDWESFRRLIADVDTALTGNRTAVTIVAVNDGSTDPCPDLEFGGLEAVRKVELLHLARNIGHQRAIAIGLAYAESQGEGDGFVVMDSDGEDRPADLPRLISEQKESGKIVFAQRGTRTEGWVFRLFYLLYRILFSLLTGKRISFGNFCVIPRASLRKVVYLPEIWNHLAAGIMRSGIPQVTVRTPRGHRYTGRSKMSFVGLIVHGLSAISVYVDIVAVRLVLLALGVIFAAGIAFLAVLYVRFLTPFAIPGWATTVGLGLSIILLQSLVFLVLVSFMVLNSRSAHLFVPIKHYEDYLLRLEVAYDRL